MKHERQTQSDVLRFVAKVLNEGGSAVLNVYDGSTNAVNYLFSSVKKTSALSEKAKKFKINYPFKKYTAKRKTSTEIKKKKKEINSLYYKIGKEQVKLSEKPGTFESDSVKNLVADVKSYEQEIKSLQTQIIEKPKKTKKPSGPPAKVAAKAPAKAGEKAVKPSKKIFAKAIKKVVEKGKAVPAKSVPVFEAIQSAIQKAGKEGKFNTDSDRAKFLHVANDLLDNEIEVKILAANELSKIGNKASVSVLITALKDNNPYLTAEVINSLINLGDTTAIASFKEKITDSHYRVRLACLRGLYKLGKDQEIKSYLMNALKDEHAEVRKTAITFIGWKDYSDALPGLVECLKDDDEKVRNAAVSALANFKDKATVLPLIKVLEDSVPDIRKNAINAIQMIAEEKIKFDYQLSGNELTKSIENLKNWWQKKRLEDIELEQPENMPLKNTKASENSSAQKTLAKHPENVAVKNTEKTKITKNSSVKKTGSEKVKSNES
ncbi:Mad23 [Candidatus Magnetomoraceae bacterium gMMP-13]